MAVCGGDDITGGDVPKWHCILNSDFSTHSLGMNTGSFPPQKLLIRSEVAPPPPYALFLFNWSFLKSNAVILSHSDWHFSFDNVFVHLHGADNHMVSVLHCHIIRKYYICT